MREDLKEVLENVLDVDSISETDSTQTVRTWDSVRHLNLILAIEERFGISFDADEIPELISVRAISRAIERSSTTPPQV
jgi:acyl carrier protein